jgi:hypothetical protein
VLTGEVAEAFATGQDESEGELLREWRAYDDLGALIATGLGPRWVFPAEAATVEVEVGRQALARVDR